jgi:hypothetical protein
LGPLYTWVQILQLGIYGKSLEGRIIVIIAD